jgi:hypothetical protein
MRVTTVIGLAGLTVVGIMLADILIHPQGTQAAGNVLIGIITPTESALLGTAPKS